jgi:hypothetical protein
MADDEVSPQPKAGGVKAMLAALNKKNADSHVVLPDGSVPKRSWKPPPKKDVPSGSNPPPDNTPQKPSLQPTPGSSRGASNHRTENNSPAMQPAAPPTSGDLSQDDLTRVRAEVAARRNVAGGAPPGAERSHLS